MSKAQDPVDRIKIQWQQERPDLRLEAMEILGRLKRCSVLYQPFLDTNFAKFELTSWEFDVLATLRRAGSPYTLTPTELFSALMVTSGTMTNRLKSLENKALILRSPNPKDARNKLVQLSKLGLKTIDIALESHVDNMESILSALPTKEKQELNDALKNLLAVFENLHASHETTHAKLSAKMHRL